MNQPKPTRRRPAHREAHCSHEPRDNTRGPFRHIEKAISCPASVPLPPFPDLPFRPPDVVVAQAGRTGTGLISGEHDIVMDHQRGRRPTGATGIEGTGSTASDLPVLEADQFFGAVKIDLPAADRQCRGERLPGVGIRFSPIDCAGLDMDGEETFVMRRGLAVASLGFHIDSDRWFPRPRKARPDRKRFPAHFCFSG